MVRIVAIIFLTALGILAAGQASSEGVIVNEAMVNEPGSQTTLEWVELYNPEVFDIFFTFCQFLIISGEDTAQVPLQTGVIFPGRYVVYCRNIVAFESAWGNGSGVWGDAPAEDYNLYQLTGISLINAAGKIFIFCSGEYSELAWSEAGLDGVTWERLHPNSTQVVQCLDADGGTPGRPNSRLPQPQDLEITSAAAYPLGSGETGLEIVVANVGLETVSEDTLFLFYDPEQDSVVNRGDLIAAYDLPDIAPGETHTVVSTQQLDGYYAVLMTQLFADDRIANNIKFLTAPGELYPPVIISEFLADPAGGQNTEWVELKNRSQEEVDIGAWYLGDSSSLHPVAGDSYLISGGEYIVLCRDSLDFIAFYGTPDFALLEPSGWPSLHNEGDLIRLVDNYSFPADSLEYDSGFGGNFTWGRGEEEGFTERWGRSIDSGGTPGSENTVLFPGTASNIEITTEPNPFSPRLHHEMEISFNLPDGGFTLKVYDIEGRVVKSFYDNFMAYEGSLNWDGRDDDGRLLPVGIYIIYVEVPGRGQHKQTVVIAP